MGKYFQTDDRDDYFSAVERALKRAAKAERRPGPCPDHRPRASVPGLYKRWMCPNCGQRVSKKRWLAANRPKEGSDV